jgi:hypothetical protein
VSNICSGLFKGMAVGAGYSATSANESAGAKSKKQKIGMGGSAGSGDFFAVFSLVYRQYF